MIGQNPQFSVSEFVAIFNQSLEMMYPMVAITGEIANLRISKGQWVYFDLKDENASVKFFGSVHRLPGPLENGMTCEVLGRPRLHNLYGFSVNFEAIRPIGEGAIKKAQELLLAKLEKEGLFLQERKRNLPYPPQRIGLITSAESAAIADFRKIIAARWPQLQIELADTLVQGVRAIDSIVGAIQSFNQMSNPPEVLVVIRGGGSSDDLAVFSEESVVRAVAGSRIPTLVAIGHERDTSLAELAADLRASTPSNAAELLVPSIADEFEQVRSRSRLLEQYVRQVIAADKISYKHALQSFNDRLAHVLLAERTYIRHATDLSIAFDPHAPLKQGYAIVRSADGRQVRSAQDLRGSDVFSLELTDGKKQIKVVGSE